MKKALIIGISGQDGAYLANFLRKKNYKIFGTSRDSQINRFINLSKLNIQNYAELLSMDLTDFRSVLQVIKTTRPHEIYNLAGQSSVSLSFEQPVETFESIVIGTLNILESIRFINKKIKFYNAGSSECFGDLDNPANENTKFNPKSPYGVSKSAAYWQVKNYREAYSMYACTGILFNHESPLRPERYVTKKIISSAYKIYKKELFELNLGNIEIERDWGWAPEYVEVMWKMLNNKKGPKDYVIGTGQSNTLKNFTKLVFDFFELDWESYVKFNNKLLRPNEILYSKCDPLRAKNDLNWEAKTKLNELINKLIKAEIEEQ